MTTAAAANQAEVALGRLATERASRPESKAFGQMMVDDHSKSTSELSSLASKKGVKLPSAPSEEQKATAARLGKLSGADFDRAFAETMVKEHEKAVELFRKESTSGADIDAKAWAAATLPTLEAHLAKARELAVTVGAGANR